jgi:hypothetical protein
MKRSFLFQAMTVAMLVGGLFAADARAGQVPLPTTLDQLLPAGAFAVTGVAPLTFSNFEYSVSPAGSPPPASAVNVKAFSVGVEDGITFQGPFQAGPGAVVDYGISYVVSVGPGQQIFDAFGSATFNLPVGTTGTVSIGETFTDEATGAIVGQIQIDPTHPSQKIFLSDNATSILVQKDILINGGSLGAGVSFVNQGFSSTGVPEPASWALLGIGMTGFLAFRRFFKKTSVA